MGDFISINPATGRELSRRPALDAAAVDAALDRAEQALPRWQEAGFHGRAEVLEAAARLLEADAKRLAALMSSEMGKPFAQGVAEAEKCAWACRFYAEHAERFLADDPHESDGSRAFVRYEPVGMLLAVMPWNFPFWQVFRMVAPALMAGNVVLVKHAASVPQCAEAIATLLRRAGAPRGVYEDLAIDHDAVERVIADPRVGALSLTGSDGAGRAVAATAGKHLKRCILELGGSDPAIVMPSADLDKAIPTILKGRTQNNGQSCIATKRVIVHAAIAEAFERRFIAAMGALKVGDPMDESVDIGPLATESIRDGLAKQVRDTVERGATCVLGGKPLPGPGFFYAPTVLKDIPDGSPAADDELFGPVASLFVVDDLDAAIAVANGTRFGLGAAAWTRDDDEITAFIDRLRAGNVFVNGLVKSDPRLPFGGIKDSGYGRELGRAGIRGLCVTKTVWVD
ncbi:MAG: NAD-dependent succinate-semialdehyde dehydrogenase [Deltaproteobacteria bacterium]|nr:NAD-dependent succinate-semialdehyde dehydrogenase [Deltaproteobacteria bacterium]